MLDPLFDSLSFTKMEIPNMWGSLRGAKGNKYKLSFVCQEGKCSYLTMPFWPIETLGYFRYFIHDILFGTIGKDKEAYLDDIMAHTKTGVDHKLALAETLKMKSKLDLWLKIEKYKL